MSLKPISPLFIDCVNEELNNQACTGQSLDRHFKCDRCGICPQYAAYLTQSKTSTQPFKVILADPECPHLQQDTYAR